MPTTSRTTYSTHNTIIVVPEMKCAGCGGSFDRDGRHYCSTINTAAPGFIVYLLIPSYV